MNEIKHICIAIAAKEEWQAFLDIIKVQEKDCNEFPYGIYKGLALEGWNCIVYHSGATKTRSAGACQYAIDHWNPKRIIVLGTAGGVGAELKDLDLVIAGRTAQHDCIEAMGAKSDFFYKMLDVDVDNRLIDLENLRKYLKVNLYSGLIATADMDVGFSKAIELREHGVLAADWESGAIAHICKMNKMPLCIIRGVSDVPVSDKEEDIILQGIKFRENAPLIMETLLNIVLPFLLSMEKI